MTPPEILNRIAHNDHDPAAQRFVVTNPSIAQEDLEHLALHGTSDIKAAAMANSRAWKPTLIAHLQTRQGDLHIRLKLASQPRLPYDAVRQLLEDPEERVRSDTLRVQNVSIDDLRRMANDPSNVVRQAVAAHFDTPPDVIEHLWRHQKWSTRLSALSHRQATRAMIEEAAEIVLKEPLPKPIKHRTARFGALDNNSVMEMASVIAAHHNTPPSVLHQMIRKFADSRTNDNTAKTVLQSAIANPNVKADTLHMFLPQIENLSHGTLHALSKHTNATSKLHQAILKSHAGNNAMDKIAASSSASTHVLRKLGSRKISYLRSLVAGNSSISSELAEEFCSDEDVGVRIAAMHHPELPASVIMMMGFSEHSDEAELAAAILQRQEQPLP